MTMAECKHVTLSYTHSLLKLPKYIFCTFTWQVYNKYINTEASSMIWKPLFQI